VVRFESFSYSPYETRRVLRDRLGRMLRPALERPSRARGPASAVTDVEILELLCRVRISHADDVDRVRQAYADHRQAHPGTPTFDDLIENGWFGVAWGRVATELNTRMSARQQDEPLRAGLEIVLSARHHDATLTFDDLSGLSPAAQALAASLAEHPENVTTIPAPSPEWVAARLWERRPQVVDVEALRWWVDRWQLLGHPLGAPTTWWTEGDAAAWRRAAIDVLRGDPGLVEWEREKGLIDARLSHEQHRIPSPPIPATLIERYVWLQGMHLDHWGRALESCGDTWVLIAMLCEDLVAHDRTLEGPSSAELLDLVVERPALLVLLATRIQQQPALLADLLLHPPTSDLACLMVADWTAQPVGAWERPLQDAENAEARERAFADAMAIAAYHQRAGGGSVEELAELLVWMHRQVTADSHALSRRPRKVTERMLEVVRSELQTLSRPQLERVLAALSFREADGLGSPRFAAAIDVATVASLTDAVDADSMVAAYVAALHPDGVPYSVALTPAQAASVVLVARRASAWTTFLAPFDVTERLASSKHAANEYTARDAIARALRAHIRVLSRAIVAWDGVPPDDVVKALASAIRTGSSDHSEKGRVAAFAARHESGHLVSRVDPPLVDDVAAACTRLPDASRTSIDEALMLIDEPLALAHLLQSAPEVLRDKVRARIDALTPDEAGAIHSLTEMQQRIEELLNAGAITAAAKYIDVERDLKTLGRVGGREVARLRWQLRLALLQSDYMRIAGTTVPDGLDRSEVASAQDALDFYKGVAELSAQSGSASTAESLFGGLAKRHPENGAYAVNLFAARVSRLLGGDTFKRLSGADIPVAREALDAADRALQNALGVGDGDRATHESNKATLLLAMGRPGDAYEALQRVRSIEDRDAVSAYGALALARMGRVEEAHATLAAGEAVHPKSAVLKAARKHVELGSPGRFRVLAVANDDNVAAIQSALFQLTNLDPGAQARVVNRETIEAHLTDEVRSAAAGVTAIVPMMRGDQLEEDDLTAFLLRILDARVRFFGWSVPDQSKGGYSAKGNPGERDLVLRKDGYVITVIEAVVCDSNPTTETTKKNLTSHFQKLFGYDQCRVFFHVVYSYVEAPHEVVATMRAIATSGAPHAFAFSHTEDLPHEDSRPVGFVATYSAQGGGEVKVVCLVMDMRQQAQRDAAALAGQTRTSPSRTQSSGAT
jgi:tetratricopeptide (TPR) repeat protein